MIPFPLIAAAIAVGGALWYLKRRGSAPAPALQQPSSGSGSKLPPHIPTPDGPGVPTSSVPTYAFTVAGDGEGGVVLVESELKTSGLFVMMNGDHTQAWIIATKLPVDVMVSVPNEVAVGSTTVSGVQTDVGNEMLSPEDSQDVFVRVKKYAGNSYVNAAPNTIPSVLVSVQTTWIAQDTQQPAGTLTPLKVFVVANA